jgi:bifunctional non-homologous end joining protein LigD
MATRTKRDDPPQTDLGPYRAKRDFDRTPEPSGTRSRRRGTAPQRRFVVHEHHARRLHWDLRLEHDGVLLSWAVPRGIPQLPKPNHLAVHTEDHPLEYLDFHGEIPSGSYGAGTMTVWDSGTYDLEKLEPDEVIVDLHGRRVQGRYVLFQTKDDQWMIHRMSPPDDPTREPMPEGVLPMLATNSTLPPDDEHWSFEMKWDGVRALAAVEGGRVRLTSRRGNDVTERYPELHKLGDALGSTAALLDGEVVALDANGRPSFELLQPRMHVASPGTARRLAARTPVVYMLFDVLWIDGHTVMGLPYTERRERLETLGLSGPSWQTPPGHVGDGRAMLETSRELGLEGVVAKRLDSRYEPGRRSLAWRKVKVSCSQEFVVGGWLPGNGRLESHLGSLLVGYHDETGALRYAGRVGSGINEAARERIEGRLAAIERDSSPFANPPRLKDAHWVEPALVVQVRFHEWTQAGILRHPRYEGLRDDIDPDAVVREPTPGP